MRRKGRRKEGKAELTTCRDGPLRVSLPTPPREVQKRCWCWCWSSTCDECEGVETAERRRGQDEQQGKKETDRLTLLAIAPCEGEMGVGGEGRVGSGECKILEIRVRERESGGLEMADGGKRGGERGRVEFSSTVNISFSSKHGFFLHLHPSNRFRSRWDPWSQTGPPESMVGPPKRRGELVKQVSSLLHPSFPLASLS